MTESELEDLESSYMGFLGDIEEEKKWSSPTSCM